MKIRIPTNKEYDKLVELTGSNNEKMHWKNIFSWVNDTENDYNLDSLYRARRGHYSARYRSNRSAPTRDVHLGFRPACELDTDTIIVDTKTGDLVVIGTLYMDGKPVKVPQNPTWNGDITDYIPGAKLEMREALDDPAYQAAGIYIGNGIAVADRILLKSISYQDIETTSINL